MNHDMHSRIGPVVLLHGVVSYKLDCLMSSVGIVISSSVAQGIRLDPLWTHGYRRMRSIVYCTRQPARSLAGSWVSSYHCVMFKPSVQIPSGLKGLIISMFAVQGVRLDTSYAHGYRGTIVCCDERPSRSFVCSWESLYRMLWWTSV